MDGGTQDAPGTWFASLKKMEPPVCGDGVIWPYAETCDDGDLPWHWELVWLSGVFEILGGIGKAS